MFNLTDLFPSWMIYGFCIVCAVFILTAICQKTFNRIEMEDIPKDPSMEAYKAATRPKRPLKELE